MAKRKIPKAELDEAVNRRLAYLNFWEYCLYYDAEFFIARPFLKKIADALQFVYDEYMLGHSVRAGASMPPRAGKSYITSLFCSWWLGRLPELSVMRNSCTSTLYDKFSYDVRSIVRSPKYCNVFSSVRLASDKQNLDGWNLSTAKQVSYFGAGVGGTIIGFGANLAISDDLYRGLEDAISPNYNEKVVRWKSSAHDSRKEKNCPEIFIGTRWSKNDIIGAALDAEKFDRYVVIPALDENGNSFCDAVKSTAEYLEIKKEIAEEIWDAEYMQEPVELKGLLFPLSKLKFYNPETTNVSSLSKFSFAFIDPAGDGGDDLSAPNARLIGDKIYIPEVIYNKHGTDYNEPYCVEFIKKNRCEAVEFEGNAAWDLMGKSIRNKLNDDNSDCEFRIMKNYTNKHIRIFAESAFIRNHFVFRQDWENFPEYRAFMKCLTSYLILGKGTGQAHDDAPDSLAGVSRYFRSHFPELWQVASHDPA